MVLILLFFYCIYTILQESNTFGMKAILPWGPLNIKSFTTDCIQIYANSKIMNGARLKHLAIHVYKLLKIFKGTLR